MGEGTIIGLPGPWADDSYEPADHYTNKIGGLPDWPIPNVSINPDLLLCGACNSHLCLVSQIYAPISSKSWAVEERVIYIFGCVAPQCGNTPVSWRALRVQKAINDEESTTPCEELVPSGTISESAAKKDWRDNLWTFDTREEDDGDDDDIDLEDLGKALSEAASLASHPQKQNIQPETIICSSTANQTQRVVDEKIPVVPCFYIYTEEEKFSKDVHSTHCTSTSMSLKENSNDLHDQSQEEAWDEESYEYDKALNADRTYLKFKKRMDANPEQCFRYSYGGKPLLANGGAESPKNCSLCGGLRHYELQLMSPLLYFLQEADSSQNKYFVDNWNWITLIVYTCSKSCTSPSEEKTGGGGWTVAEEAVIVQTE